MDAAASAAIALQKAQATQIHAGLGLWPAAVTAKLAEDGTYPGAEAIFAEAPQPTRPTADFNFDPAQLRDPRGQWRKGEGGPRAPDGTSIAFASHHHEEEEETAGGSSREPVDEPYTPPVPIVPNLLRKLPSYSAPVIVYPPLIAEPIVPRATGVPSVPPTPSGTLVPVPANAPTRSPSLPRGPSPEIPASVCLGPFARESIPAGPMSRPSLKQQQDINALFETYGCHSCGTTDPGTRLGNAVGDHQPPTGVNPQGADQGYYPQCIDCSWIQGGRVRALKAKGLIP